jgi:hypothetical protein
MDHGRRNWVMRGCDEGGRRTMDDRPQTTVCRCEGGRSGTYLSYELSVRIMNDKVSFD